MPDLAYKDLCIDVTAGTFRPVEVSAFWSIALALDVAARPDGVFRLAPSDGTEPERAVWINPVPERPKSKSRVHLDIRVEDGDPAGLAAAGGTLVREPLADEPWYVLHDPDGLVLCAYADAPDRSAVGPIALVVDATEPATIAAWWAERTGGTVTTAEDGASAWIEGAAGFPYEQWRFVAVPEAKRAKNRVHWDVRLVDATVDALVASGATVLRVPDDEIRWTVMSDPEGNEFCAFP